MYLVPALGIVGLLFMIIKAVWVTKQDAGDEGMQKLAGYIADGALAFLKAEWRVMAIFVVIAGVLLAWSGTLVEHSDWVIAVAFVIRAFFSAFAGWIGMNIATKPCDTSAACGQLATLVNESAKSNNNPSGPEGGRAMAGKGPNIFVNCKRNGRGNAHRTRHQIDCRNGGAISGTGQEGQGLGTRSTGRGQKGKGTGSHTFITTHREGGETRPGAQY